MGRSCGSPCREWPEMLAKPPGGGDHGIHEGSKWCGIPERPAEKPGTAGPDTVQYFLISLGWPTAEPVHVGSDHVVRLVLFGTFTHGAHDVAHMPIAGSADRRVLLHDGRAVDLGQVLADGALRSELGLDGAVIAANSTSP